MEKKKKEFFLKKAKYPNQKALNA